MLQRGFTLIELMVVVVIVGILAAVGIPNYKNHIVQGKLVEAHSNLMALRTNAEQFFQDNRTYVGLCTTAPANTTTFSYACSGLAAATYTITATALTGKGVDSWSFTIDQNNTHTTASVPTGATAPSPNDCWSTKASGVC